MPTLIALSLLLASITAARRSTSMAADMLPFARSLDERLSLRVVPIVAPLPLAGRAASLALQSGGRSSSALVAHTGGAPHSAV